MRIEEFAELTKRIVRGQGIEYFQPTGCFPARQDVRVLSDIPANVDVEHEVITWARQIAHPEEEFLVAFKAASTVIKIIRIEGVLEEQALIKVDL